MRYITKVLLGLDQFANTIIGGAPDETISARAGRQALANTKTSRLVWHPLARLLNTLQPEHVEKAIMHERDGSQQDPAYRDVYVKAKQAEAAQVVADAAQEQATVAADVASDAAEKVK